MASVGDNIALLGLVVAVVGIFAGVSGSLAQILVTHFVGKRAETQAQDHFDRDRDREITTLVREGLENDARWRELIYTQRERTEQRHSENLQAIEREAKAVDHLATEVHELGVEFRQWRGRQSGGE